MAGRKMPKTVQTRGLSMLRRGLPMRLRHIEVFNAIMLTGSVSAAARLINVTQPAVSRTLQHAELQLGFPLFRRDKGRLTPTAEALTLHPHVQRLFAQLDEVDRLAASLRDQGDGGSLRIVTVMALTQDVLPRALQAFRARHPRVKLRVEAQHSPQVMAQLLLREADIGFAFSPAVHPGLREERLADTPVVCVAPRGVLPGALVESARVGLADLAGLPMLARQGTPVHASMAAVMAAQSGSPRPPGNGQNRSGLVSIRNARLWNQMASNAICSLRYSNVRSYEATTMSITVGGSFSFSSTMSVARSARSLIVSASTT